MAKCLAEHVSIHTLRGILLLFSLNLFHFQNRHLSSSSQLLTLFVTSSKFLFHLLSLFKSKTRSINPHETFCIFLLTLNPNHKIVKHHDTYFSIHVLRGILLWFYSSLIHFSSLHLSASLSTLDLLQTAQNVVFHVLLLILLYQNTEWKSSPKQSVSSS